MVYWASAAALWVGECGQRGLKLGTRRPPQGHGNAWQAGAMAPRSSGLTHTIASLVVWRLERCTGAFRFLERKRAAKLGTHRHALEGLEVSQEGGHTRPRSRGSQAGQGALADFQTRRSCPHEAAPPPWPKAPLSCRVPFPETRNGLYWWFCIRLGGPRVQAPAPRRGRLTRKGRACPPPAPCLSCGSGPRMP